MPRFSLARLLARTALIFGLVAGAAQAAETVNVYSIWPENWARPMFEEFEKATGIKVNSFGSPPAKSWRA